MRPLLVALALPACEDKPVPDDGFDPQPMMDVPPQEPTACEDFLSCMQRGDTCWMAFNTEKKCESVICEPPPESCEQTPIDLRPPECFPPVECTECFDGAGEAATAEIEACAARCAEENPETSPSDADGVVEWMRCSERAEIAESFDACDAAAPSECRIDE